MRIKIIFLLMMLMLAVVGCSQDNVQEQNTQTTAQVASEPSNNAFSNEPSCPRGVENDPAPGACFQYADTNSDGLCDLGE
jgi:hypothetical protein